MAKTLAYKVSGSVYVVVHGKDDPNNEEWSAYLTYYKEYAKNSMRTLVVSDGGGPNATQRATLNAELEAYGELPTVAICTDSRMVRGMVTAVSWFNNKVQAFHKEDIMGALTYLGVTGDEATAAAQAVAELQEQVRSG